MSETVSFAFGSRRAWILPANCSFIAPLLTVKGLAVCGELLRLGFADRDLRAIPGGYFHRVAATVWQPDR